MLVDTDTTAPRFGNGLEDGGWNAWIGNMESANELLGLLHGAYGLGATISPLIATSMVTKGDLPVSDTRRTFVCLLCPSYSASVDGVESQVPAAFSRSWPCFAKSIPHNREIY